MRRTKPDYIQKIARDFAKEVAQWDGETFDRDELAVRLEKLLRLEHEAALRIIKQNKLRSSDKAFDEGWNHCLDDLLCIFKQRAQ